MTFGNFGPIDWLNNGWTALPAIILLSSWQGFPFQMVVYLAGLQQINPELYEAARVDGATRRDEFWHVTMPGLHVTFCVTHHTSSFGCYLRNGATSTNGEAKRLVPEVFLPVILSVLDPSGLHCDRAAGVRCNRA